MHIVAADLQMLADVVALAEDAEPVLIGAMALEITLAEAGMHPLPRVTRDWDFAVAISAWPAFTALADRLVAAGAFRRDAAPQRFHHRGGGVIDLVPFGSLEDPPGSLLWPSGHTMSTIGFAALQQNHRILALGTGLSMAVATLPALIGLKLVAYGDRRPTEVRDIRDVHHVARESAWPDPAAFDHIAEEAVRDGRVTFADLGAFQLGRIVAAAFGPTVCPRLLDVLSDAHDPWSQTVTHVVKASHAVAEEDVRSPIANCLGALRAGIAAPPDERVR
jgi:predicted nucleotidyltransferase